MTSHDPRLELPAGCLHVHWLERPRGAGRLPLCRVLGAYLGVEASRVELLQDGPTDKPQLADSWLQFNWSHSRDAAVVVVAREMAVGIDLEFGDRRVRYLALAERFFSAAEVARLRDLPAATAERAFLRLWTGKEAVLKALGLGLSAGLDRIEPAPDARPGLHVLDPELSAQPVRLESLAVPHDNSLASVAWIGDRCPTVHFLALRPIDPDRLHPPCLPGPPV